MQSSGRADLVEETFREHRRRGRDADEKEQVEEPEPKRKAGPSLGERLRAMKWVAHPYLNYLTYEHRDSDDTLYSP